MSRYLLLFILNVPFILTGILSIVTQYKTNHATRGKLISQLIIWLIILTGLILAQPVFNWLFINKLTESDSLSLFDVVQITAIVLLFYITNRMRLKLEITERRFQDLHQELSIKLSTNKKTN